MMDNAQQLDRLLENNEKLLESNQKLIDINERLIEVNNGWNDLASKMFALLTKPTEGPKRGKWVTDIEVAGEKGVGCDQCKTFFAYTYGGKKHNFCPQCGADMREERNLNEQMQIMRSRDQMDQDAVRKVNASGS